MKNYTGKLNINQYPGINLENVSQGDIFWGQLSSPAGSIPGTIIQGTYFVVENKEKKGLTLLANPRSTSTIYRINVNGHYPDSKSLPLGPMFDMTSPELKFRELSESNRDRITALDLIRNVTRR